MSAQQPQNVSYGLSQALIKEAPYPIASRRSPRVSDFAVVGTIWSNIVTNQIYILASISNNAANWLLLEVGGGAGVFANLTVTPGPTNITGLTNINTVGAGITNINRGGTGALNLGNATGGVDILGATTITGTTNINTAGAAVTNIGLGGTGAVNIGNPTGGVVIAGGLSAGGANIDLNSVGAFTTFIGVAPGTGQVQIGNGTGNTYIVDGNLNVTTGNVILQDALSGYTFLNGVTIFSGMGDPNGVANYASPIGSLYLNSAPTGTTDRLFVNTNGGTVWTYFASNA